MDSALIETIIGIVLAYSLLSLLVSAIIEFVRAVLSLLTNSSGRSEFLKKELENMLGGGSSDFVEAVLKSPLVDVFRIDQGFLANISEALKHKKTTHVDTRNLATAIIQSAKDQPGVLPQELEAIVGTIKSQDAIKAATTNFQEVQAELNSQRELIEDWINKRYADMTEKFKRSQFVWSLLFGFILVAALNVDTIQMAQVMWKDPTLRAALVQSATDTASAEGQQADAEGDGEEADVNESKAAVEAALNDLLDANLPIMWKSSGAVAVTNELGEVTYPYFDQGKDPRVLAQVRNEPVLWPAKLLGLGVTVIAVSLGKDFWFNFLRRLTQRGD